MFIRAGIRIAASRTNQNTQAVFIQSLPLTRYRKRPTLYVNPSFTTRIKAFLRKRANTILELLFAHQSRPEFQIRFQWTVNAIALWDNRSAQHFAMWDYWPQPRQGHRVTIKGEPPQRGDFNQSRNYENLRLSRSVL